MTKRSMGEWKRLIKQGGVRINGEKVLSPDQVINIEKDKSYILQVGKREFLKIIGK